VIGGHAVAAYGFARTTEDLDFLIRKSERAQWSALLQGSGYSLAHDGGSFLQFTSSAVEDWDIDLMLTEDGTFQKILDDSKPATLCGAAVQIPALDHLLALKLHALKNSQTRRFLKDFGDVCNLIQANKVDVRSAQFKKLALKFGNHELYDEILSLEYKA
jgi:hypothetical protein